MSAGNATQTAAHTAATNATAANTTSAPKTVSYEHPVVNQTEIIMRGNVYLDELYNMSSGDVVAGLDTLLTATEDVDYTGPATLRHVRSCSGHPDLCIGAAHSSVQSFRYLFRGLASGHDGWSRDGASPATHREDAVPPLAYALAFANRPVVDFLVSQGARVDYEGISGAYSVLRLAVRLGDGPLMKILLKRRTASAFDINRVRPFTNGTLISEALRCCAAGKKKMKKMKATQKIESAGTIPGPVLGVLGRCSPPLIQVLIEVGKAKLKWSEVPAVVLKGWTKTKPEMAMSLVRAAEVPNMGVGRVLLKSRLQLLSKPAAQKKARQWIQASTLLFDALDYWNNTLWSSLAPYSGRPDAGWTLDALQMGTGTNGTGLLANETLLWMAVKGKDDEGARKLVEVGICGVCVCVCVRACVLCNLCCSVLQ